MAERTDAELLAELGVEPVAKKVSARSPREARIIVGFEEIQKFVDEHGHPPRHGEDLDIFERLYSTRLERLRDQADCHDLLKDLDHQGLLATDKNEVRVKPEELDDDALLAALGVEASGQSNVTELKHVRSQAEKRAAEEIANREKCADFDSFEPLFAEVREDLKTGRRKTRRYAKMAGIKQGEFFIINGQIAYVAKVGEEFDTDYERRDSRLRVIYDNGTESNLLLRSLQRALHRDGTGRRVTDPDAGPLFAEEDAYEGTETGTIYVLRSKSEHPDIADKRDVIHKIGVTGGSVEKRIANADREPTFLMAPVEVVATYKLVDINRTALENLLHRYFGSARLDISIPDRFGGQVKPREWFLVPLHVINEVVSHLKDGTLHEFSYDLATASLIQIEK